MSLDAKFCKVCSGKGDQTSLRLFQINFNEALWMCPKKECPFPLNVQYEEPLIVRRSLAQLHLAKKGCRSRSVSRSTSCASSRASSPVLRCNPGQINKVQNGNGTSSKALAAPLQSKLNTLKLEKERTLTNSTVPTQNSSLKATLPVSSIFDLKSPPKPERIKPVCGKEIGYKNEPNANSSVDLQSFSSNSLNKLSSETLIPNRKAAETYIRPTETSITPERRMEDINRSLIYNNDDVKVDNTDKAEVHKEDGTSNSKYHVQWTNKEALCWLDVAMCLLVHSPGIQLMLESRPDYFCTNLRNLFTSYKQAQKILAKALELKRYQLLGQRRNLMLETSVGLVAVKTGGGSNAFSEAPLIINTDLSPISSGPKKVIKPDKPGKYVITTEELQLKSEQLTNDSKQIMSNIREKIWHYLHPKLKCSKGQNDSPVFALPFLVGEDPAMKENFNHRFTWKMKCTKCGYVHSDSVSKTVITFPAVPTDFSMRCPYFLRSCFQCGSQGQRMQMCFVDYPPVILTHFVEGLHKELHKYDFRLKRNAYYTVTGVIQYKHQPDHFVAWIRNPKLNLWMECDDLKQPLCRYTDVPPDFSPSQVHMVMWTRKANDCNPPKPLKSVLKSPPRAVEIQTYRGMKKTVQSQQTNRMKFQPKQPIKSGEKARIEKVNIKQKTDKWEVKDHVVDLRQVQQVVKEQSPAKKKKVPTATLR